MYGPLIDMNKLHYNARNYFSLRPYRSIIHLNSFASEIMERVTDKRRMPVAVRNELEQIKARRNGKPEVYRVMLDIDSLNSEIEKPVWAVYNAFSYKTQEIVRLFGPRGERFGRMRVPNNPVNDDCTCDKS